MLSNDTFSRRTILATAAAGALLGALPAPVSALSVDTATNLVQRIVEPAVIAYCPGSGFGFLHRSTPVDRSAVVRAL